MPSVRIRLPPPTKGASLWHHFLSRISLAGDFFFALIHSGMGTDPSDPASAWGQTPKVDTCTWGDLGTWIYMKEAQKSTKKRKTANKSKKYQA